MGSLRVSSAAASRCDRPHPGCLPHAGGLSPLHGTDWALLVAVAAFAAAVRIVFFTGFFGSDEVTYVESAIAAANGYWPNSTYIGSIRLGVNYPIAASMALFGHTEIAASLWGFVCSVVEVTVVFWFARRVSGRELALVASLLMALLPLHVHLAGRIMADSPLALFMSLSFVFLFEAENRNRCVLYLLSGVCAGLTFWIKESATIFVGVLVLWAFFFRQRDLSNCLWAAVGMIVVISANFALMWALSGNPLHLLDSVKASMSRYADPSRVSLLDRSPLYYLNYLFVRPWHTWLLGYLAAMGATIAIVRSRRRSAEAVSRRYLLVWGLGLLGVFSLFVLSVSPLRLIPKQTNYMTTFFAPLCLLAGLAIMELKYKLARVIVVGAYVVGALVLCALEQQTIHAFTANSKASLVYATQHPGSTIHVTANTERLNQWVGILSGTGLEHARNLRPLSELRLLPGRPPPEAMPATSERGIVLAIVDQQTLDWGDNGLRSVRDIPVCWEKVAELQAPEKPTGGRLITSWALTMVRFLPGTISSRMGEKLESLLTPLPASIYRVPANCG